MIKKGYRLKTVKKVICLLISGLILVMIYPSPCLAKNFFKKTTNFVMRAVTAPVKMVTGLFHNKKSEKKNQGTPELRVHAELHKELVKKRNDLLWANQKTLLEDLVNNKSTKITRGEMFVCELEYEEKILGLIEKQMSLLCYNVVSDNKSDKKFVDDIQKDLLVTILLKERIHKLLQVVQTK